MNILLFGPPGAGKGTQSQLLFERCGMKHISTGNLFREAISGNTPLGEKASVFLDKGQLVPDDITIDMLSEVLEGLSQSESFTLDGFPRTLPQAEALKEKLQELNLHLQQAVFLDVPQQELEKRLIGRRVCKKCKTSYHLEKAPPQKEGLCDSCGGELIQRQDDQSDIVLERLNVYEKSTQPLREYYDQSGQLATIDGSGSAEEVFENIKSIL